MTLRHLHCVRHLYAELVGQSGRDVTLYALLCAREHASVHDLAAALLVSPARIRRDLGRALADARKLDYVTPAYGLDLSAADAVGTDTRLRPGSVDALKARGVNVIIA